MLGEGLSSIKCVSKTGTDFFFLPLTDQKKDINVPQLKLWLHFKKNSFSISIQPVRFLRSKLWMEKNKVCCASHKYV